MLLLKPAGPQITMNVDSLGGGNPNFSSIFIVGLPLYPSQNPFESSWRVKVWWILNNAELDFKFSNESLHIMSFLVLLQYKNLIFKPSLARTDD